MYDELFGEIKTLKIFFLFGGLFLYGIFDVLRGLLG